MNEVTEPPKSHWLKIAMALCFLILLGAGAAGYWHYYMRGILFSDDARLDGELLDLASKISGTLTDVFVKEGDSISKGELLFTLDKRSLTAVLEKEKANVKSAEAELAVARAQYDKCLHGPRREEIHMAEAAERRAATHAKLAATEWERVKVLNDSHVITESTRDKLRTASEAAGHAHEETKIRLELLHEGTREEDISVARANVQLKQAKVAAAKTNVRVALVDLENTKVHAPFDSVIVRRWQDPGAILSAGRPVLTIFNPASLHISANIEEVDLHKVSIGAKVDVTVDAYPHLSLTGHVDKILQATNSQFSLIPAEGSSGAFIKVVQRIPIRVAVDNYPDLSLGPGLSVEIRIHTPTDSLFREDDKGDE
ncbi:HlyD family secretion protein [Thermodesulfobacteriota bacterium]